MAETSLDRRFGQVHQRVDAHEQRLMSQETRVTRLEVDAAAQAAAQVVRDENIDRRLTEIHSGITWVTRLVIGGILTGIIAFVIAGGLNVVP
jgi:hypothetical protein